MNHCSQAWFHRLWCSFEANADKNAAFNMAERFSDEKLNSLPCCDVEKT
jgi:transposase